MPRDDSLRVWSTLRERVMTGADTLPAVIDELSLHVCASLPVSGAGLLIATSGHRRAVVGASDDRMRRLEQLQATFDEGPCMDAVRGGGIATEPDLANALDRWPAFGPAAVTEGIVAVFSFPVQVKEVTLGALDCYHGSTGAMTPTQLRDGELFADISADLIMHAQSRVGVGRVVDQLTESDGAGVVEQAAGVTAFLLGIPVGVAVARLRHHATSHGLSLDDTAAAIVGGTLQIEP